MLAFKPGVCRGQNTCIALYASPTAKNSAFSVYITSAVQFHAGIACWLERRTRDRKVASSNPGRRIFFSGVNFVCADSYSVSVPPPSYRSGT